MKKQPIRPTGKPAQKTAENQNPHSAGMTFRTQVTNPLHREMGDSNPDRLREINILTNKAKKQLEWANEEKKASDLLNEYRRKIEALRSETEKAHFQNEKQIDELVLAAELAGEAYQAHQRELTARKGETVKFIKAAEGHEIELVAHTFAERIRAKKSKSEIDKQAVTAKYNAEIEQQKVRGKKEIDPAVTQAKAIQAQRMRAYIAGKPMEEVNAIGASSNNNQQSQPVALLDRFSFNFGK